MLEHRVYVPNMEPMKPANMMTAPITPDLDLNIVSNTAAEGRTSRAQWRAAPPPLDARVSAATTAAGVQANAGLQNAHSNQSASASSATSMVGMAFAHTHQDAARLHSRQVETAGGIPASK